VFIALYMLTGVIAGLIAGLFGVGGGLIIVPILVTLFTALQFEPQWIMHMAVGTSMVTILFTSLSAIWVHHKKQAILWKIVVLISLGVSVGAWLGVKLLAGLSSQMLQIMFSCFMFYMSITMYKKSVKDKSERINETITMPNSYLHAPSGVIIGLISSLFGIGGGSLTVPYLTKLGVSIKQAVATSSACGWFIAFFASISFILAKDTGWQFSTGWIYWPAMLSIVLTSLIFARIGAKLAHRLNSASLTKWFALMLALLSIKMAVSVLIDF